MSDSIDGGVRMIQLMVVCDSIDGGVSDSIDGSV